MRTSGVRSTWGTNSAGPTRCRSAHPPHERLGGANDARRQLDDRLVVDDDLALLERVLEVTHDASVERRPGNDRLVARVALRRVHLAVGPGEQLPRASAVLREQRPADRRVDLHERRRRRGTGAAARGACGRRARPPPSSSAVPSDSTTNSSPPTRATVSVSRTTALEPAAIVRSTALPDLVAAHVVDALEAVEVDDEQRERLARAPRARERLLDAVVEQVRFGSPVSGSRRASALRREHAA